MKLNEKLKVLRELEGRCRGLNRSLSKAETGKLIREEIGQTISLPYLSQLESGTRTHMTNKTRLLLARFFRVHPGFLVEDPHEFREHLATPLGGGSQSLPEWLRVGAARFAHDPMISDVLARLSAHPERRKALRLLGDLLEMPTLMDRLLHTLHAKHGSEARRG
jgi:hypothetical protein